MPSVAGSGGGAARLTAENTDRYEWALISGGPPSIPTETGCRTRENTSNNSGLWIFARVPFPPPAQNAAVRDVAKSLGFDVSGTWGRSKRPS